MDYKQQAEEDMTKKQQNKKLNTNLAAAKQEPEISERAERAWSLLLKIMSWIIGISALAVVILPNFNFPYLAILVKVIFFLGLFNLLLFALIELFGPVIKKLFSKLV
jgi:uncharacterized membrane protein